jgi:2-methylisocitrate lyase-like PEP mutase family enzyme
MAQPDRQAKAARFLELHHRLEPLLLANAWDEGSAKLLASLGFQALATTSSGHAATLGKLDYSVSRDEALAHAGALAKAVELPMSADLENGLAEDPPGVAETMRLTREAGLAGCSVEDWDAAAGALYEPAAAAERVVAAAEAAHAGSVRLVLTARAENHLRGKPDLDDTIARLQLYQRAGADVLYAPGLTTGEEIRAVVSSVDLPVNVLARPGVPPVAELGQLGVKRVSVGGAFAFAGLAGAANAARELLDEGTYRFSEQTAAGVKAARAAFERSAGDD